MTKRIHLPSRIVLLSAIAFTFLAISASILILDQFSALATTTNPANPTEDWIEQVVPRDIRQRDGSKGTIEFVRGTYARGIRANFEFYRDMAKLAEGNGETALALHHNLMAEIYQSLMPDGEHAWANKPSSQIHSW